MMNNLFVQIVISYCLVFVVPLILPIAFIKLVGLGGLRELVTYEAKDTPLHNLDPRLKVLYPVAMGILSILLTWTLMLAVFGLSLIPWFWLRPSRAKIRVLTVMVIGPALAGFWAAVLGRQVAANATADHAVLPAGDGAASGPRIIFNKVPEPKIVKNRVHLDIVSDTYEAEAERLLSLGAQRLNEVEKGRSRWTTFADIEGNEFDLIAG